MEREPSLDLKCQRTPQVAASRRGICGYCNLQRLIMESTDTVLSVTDSQVVNLCRRPGGSRHSAGAERLRGRKY